MSNETRIEFRAFDVNGNICGYGETAQEALANMAETIGEPLFDKEEDEEFDEDAGVHWRVMSFAQERYPGTYEWVDLDEGEGDFVDQS